jgi:hypothetical protein
MLIFHTVRCDRIGGSFGRGMMWLGLFSAGLRLTAFTLGEAEMGYGYL